MSIIRPVILCKTAIVAAALLIMYSSAINVTVNKHGPLRSMWANNYENFVYLREKGPIPPPIGSRIQFRNTIDYHYVSWNAGFEPVKADRSKADGWESFLVVNATSSDNPATAVRAPVEAGNVVALLTEGFYFSSMGGNGVMYAKAKAIGNNERFVWIATGDGSFSLRCSNGMYMSVANMESPVTCNSDSLADSATKFVFAGEVRAV